MTNKNLWVDGFDANIESASLRDYDFFDENLADPFNDDTSGAISSVYNKTQLMAVGKTELDQPLDSLMFILENIQTKQLDFHEQQRNLAFGMLRGFSRMHEAVLDVKDVVCDVKDAVDEGFAKKTPVKRKPRLLRSAMDDSMAKDIFSLWKDADLLTLRDITATVLAKATGCRQNELRHLTFEHVDLLITTQHMNIFSTKLNRFEVKAVSDESSRQLKVLANRMRIMLKLKFDCPIPPKTYVFSSWKTIDAEPVTADHFLYRVNAFLIGQSKKYSNVDGNSIVTLRSHSGRIGFVTDAICSNMDTNEVKKLVGHEDIRSTLKYDRAALTSRKRIDHLNNIESNNQQMRKLREEASLN